MPRRAVYSEGDWFGVPLVKGGFGIGVIARANPKGVLLGYFFGPKRERCPTMSDVVGLRKEDAVLVRMFGHLGLKGGSSAILGRQDGWNRDDWPMPIFIRREEFSGRILRVFYDPDDPNRWLRDEVVPSGSAEGPEDGLSGAGALEIRLTELLCGA